MFNNVRISLFGLRKPKTETRKKSRKVKGASSPKKKLVQIPDSEIANAKAIHIFYRTSPRANWVRATDDLIQIPALFKSKASKIDFVESTAQFYFNELVDYGIIKVPKPKKVKEPKAPKAPKPKPVKPTPQEPIASPEDFEEIIAETSAHVNLPELPEKPRTLITKKQFWPLIRFLIVDELNMIGSEWSQKRIEQFIQILWNNYSDKPHLIVSDQFRRNLVIHEIAELTKKERAERALVAQESFREKLQNKEVTLDADTTAGRVTVQYKEVFNKERMSSPDDMTMVKYDKESKQRYLADRQSIFAQVVCDYDEMIQVDSDDIIGGQEMLDIAIQKIRDDVTKLFNQAIDNGVFSFGDEPEYSVRLSIPLLDKNGEVLPAYYNRDGELRSGWGYSTHRMTIGSIDDLDDLIDTLFKDIAKDIAKYIQVNSAGGMGFSGFLIERKMT